MRLSGHGITVELPSGWEGAIGDAAPLAAQEAQDLPPERRPRRDLSLAHFASFPLPPRRGDFGSGAVEVMGARDAFVALVEYGAESTGTALFAAEGLPRRLDPESFSPRMLQRTLAGQAGMQAFFTDAGRAFCLYVVLGSARNPSDIVGDVNRVLADIEVASA